MSDRTAPALAKLDALLPLTRRVPASPTRTQLVDEAEALKRAVARFTWKQSGSACTGRSPDRSAGDPPDRRSVFDELRHTLETAGFHTRSHA